MVSFSRLRLLGFKSFVEPADFVIETGLTGVVGPNGCGKSNLVEALRWVMGESSYKNMRASGMDDVIFSGSGSRPARNTAEVTLVIDNQARTAPAAFNDADLLEVTRRIEREAGSEYRINGREVRARDVQLLFADASTGAHSPSMVGQGRVGELIAAKPQARRALLEEAAGVAGLHSRRHEAELRLNAAEQNLSRLDDVVAEIDVQLEALRRQARQAVRYRNISGDIRKAEATVLYLRWVKAAEAVAEAEAALAEARKAFAASAEVQAGAARDQAVAAAALPPLRDRDVAARAALQRLTHAGEALEAEEKRVRDRLAELAGRIAQAGADIAREERIAAEDAAVLARLDGEEAQLTAESEAGVGRAAAAAEALAAAEAALAERERLQAEATAALAELNARRGQHRRAADEAAERVRRQEGELAGVRRELEGLLAASGHEAAIASGRAAVAAAETRLAEAEAAAIAGERAAAAAREAEAAAGRAAAAAGEALARQEAEAAALAKLLDRGAARRAPLIDAVTVAAGWEAALAAAFGEELDLSADPAAPAHWREVAGEGDAPLPAGIAALAEKVGAPPVLARRLAQIGIVGRADGLRLQASLRPGQALVSREGDLWRWDGYVAAAEAPTAAAIRLANRNRLAELQAGGAALRSEAEARRKEASAAIAAARTAAEAERRARDDGRAAQRALDAARQGLAEAERQAARAASRIGALREAESRLAAGLAEAEAVRARAAAALAGLPQPALLEQRLAEQRSTVAAGRSAVAAARAERDGLAREAELRVRRLAAIAGERETWKARAAGAAAQIAALAERRAGAEREHQAIAGEPEAIRARRAALLGEIAAAEAARDRAGSALAAAEAAQAAADKAAQAALDALSTAREGRGRAEERLASAEARREEAAGRIAELLDATPIGALEIAGLKPAAPLPDLAQMEARAERLRQERERLGAVNLRAEEEAEEVAARRDTLVVERDDLIEAIQRLRQAIGSLNREGRERLLAAFRTVDEHFRRLFTHLFGGGTAELQLTESDDPLEAGLEILARPPGKKPQTMTLLSGGEQALTALALIFAVFLTNPAPICVLDEVDAPLDDANVERFCSLLEEMTRQTDTRFLVVTHNPITMSRMNRLFGVTMAERGVSQLVSVDLETAERFREAG